MNTLYKKQDFSYSIRYIKRFTKNITRKHAALNCLLLATIFTCALSLSMCVCINRFILLNNNADDDTSAMRKSRFVYIATNPFKFLPIACVAWHCMAWLVGVVCTVTDVSYQTRYRIGLNNFCACILNYSARALFMEIMHACVCVCVFSVFL